MPPHRPPRTPAFPRLALLAVCACLLLACQGVASATAARPLPAAALRELAAPGGPELLVAGAHGDLWFTQPTAAGGEVGRVTPDGAIAEHPLGAPGSVPFGLAWGPDGRLWVALTATDPARKSGVMVRLAPDGGIVRFPLPPLGAGRPFANALTVGPDGALWFVESTRDAIGRMTTDGALTEYSLHRSHAGPGAIAAGPDGNLWVLEYEHRAVARVTPSGAVTEFPVKLSGGSNAGIVEGSIIAGPDGNLWFSCASGFTATLGRPTDQVGRITPDGRVTLFPLPTTSAVPRGIASGPDGNLWITEFASGVGNIARVTPQGAVTEYALPDRVSGPAAIAADPVGNLWITESARDRLARLAPSLT